MYSTWRSGESRGYCDLHRRGLELLLVLCGIATWFDGRRNEVWELGDRLSTEGEGVSRGKPFVLERLGAVPEAGKVSNVSSDGR